MYSYDLTIENLSINLYYLCNDKNKDLFKETLIIKVDNHFLIPLKEIYNKIHRLQDDYVFGIQVSSDNKDLFNITDGLPIVFWLKDNEVDELSVSTLYVEFIEEETAVASGISIGRNSLNRKRVIGVFIDAGSKISIVQWKVSGSINFYCNKYEFHLFRIFGAVPISYFGHSKKAIKLEKMIIHGSVQQINLPLKSINYLMLHNNATLNIRRANLKLIYMERPDNSALTLYDCSITYDSKITSNMCSVYWEMFQKKENVNNFMSTYDIIYDQHYLKKYKSDIHRYYLFFEANMNYFKRFLFFINGGYYKILIPAILTIFYLYAFWNEWIPLPETELKITEFFNVNKIANSLRKINTINQLCKYIWNSFLYISFGYSAFSLLTAMKRRFGFPKK